MVSYAGDYHITSSPSAALATGLATGTFELDVNFGLLDNAISGTANDGTAAAGVFSGGMQTRGGAVEFSDLTFTGSGSLANRQGDLDVSFFGDYSQNVVASGALTDGSTNVLMGLEGNSEAIDFLDGLSTVTNAASATTSSTARSFRRSGNVITRTVGGSATYTFNSPTSRNGHIVSTNNNMRIVSAHGAITDVSFLIVGTNLNDLSQATISNINLYQNQNLSSQRTPHANRPVNNVTYQGNYIIGRVPSGSQTVTSHAINRGTFNLVLDFGASGVGIAPNAVQTGSHTYDSAGVQTGTFSNGQIESGGSIPINLRDLHWDVASSLASSHPLNGVSRITLLGSFYGSGSGSEKASEVDAAGRSAAVSGKHVVMGLVGARAN